MCSRVAGKFRKVESINYIFRYLIKKIAFMRLQRSRTRGSFLLNILIVTGVLGGGALGFYLQDRAMKSLTAQRAAVRTLPPPPPRRSSSA